MNVYSICTQLCKTTLYTFIKLHLKSLLIYLLYYQTMNVILMHGINKIIIYITFINNMNILQIVYQQLPIEVNCVLLLLYTFIYLYLNFMPFYINDGAARVTHFSSTLTISLDQLTN